MQPALQTTGSSGIPQSKIQSRLERLARRRSGGIDEITKILSGDDAPVKGHAAGTVFADPAGRILLLKRTGTPGVDNFVGHWALPGGGVEDGETPEEGATREAHEELGGTAPEGEKRKIHEKRTPTGMVFHTFRQDVPEAFKPKLNDEHSDYSWSSVHDLPEPMHPAVSEMLGGMAADEFTESDHPRAPDGKFGSGGGSGGSSESNGEEAAAKSETASKKTGGIGKHAETFKKHAAAAREFIKDKSAGEVLAAVAKDHRTKEVLAYSIECLLSHGTGVIHHATGGAVPNIQGLDPSTWELNKEAVGQIIHHFGDIAQVTAAQARATIKSGIEALIKHREAMKMGPKSPELVHDEEEDGVLAALRALLEALDDEGEEEKPNPEGASDSCRFALDRDSVRAVDHDGRLHVEVANISKATVNPYVGREVPDWEKLGLDPDRVYQLFRDPEELKKATPTFNGLQLLRKHIPVSADDHQPWDTVGALGNDAEFVDPYLRNSLTIWARDAIDGVETGKQKELSCGYRYAADMTPGIFDGMRFDGVMRSIVGNHVALVEDGRAGADVVVGDSNEEMANMSARDQAKKINAQAARQVSVSALVTYLKPRLAMDARIDMAKVFDGVTGAKFKSMKPVIAQRIIEQAKPKLAQDATLEQVEQVLDMLDGHEIEAGDESVSAPEHKAMEAAAHGASTLDIPKKVGEEFVEKDKGKAFDAEAFKGFLKGKGMGEDDINSAMGMLPKPTGMDEMEDDDGAMDESEEDKKKREAEEAREKAAKDAEMKKDMVSKPAMDAAIKTAVDKAIENTTKTIRATERDKADALREVRPWVGELAMSFDSGEEVRRHALKMLGVETHATLPEGALSTVLGLCPKPGSDAGLARRAQATAMGMDADTSKGLNDLFPGLSRIGVG